METIQQPSPLTCLRKIEISVLEELRRGKDGAESEELPGVSASHLLFGCLGLPGRARRTHSSTKYF